MIDLVEYYKFRALYYARQSASVPKPTIKLPAKVLVQGCWVLVKSEDDSLQVYDFVFTTCFGVLRLLRANAGVFVDRTPLCEEIEKVLFEERK